MGDYMFILESHLSADQFRVVGEICQLAAEAGTNVFLTGGALRDVLGGFPVRDLDFTIEGNALKLAKVAEKKYGAHITSTDELRKSCELVFPGDVPVELAMARQERYAKSSGKPQITQSGVHEDVQGRDFTCNAVAVSLNKASLGLMIDPTNGMGDIERKELRTTHNYSFYDDPSRMIRLIRYKARLSFTIDERTRAQFENAKEAGMLERIPAEALGRELRAIAAEINSADVVAALADENLWELYVPGITSKIDHKTLMKLQKARQIAPLGSEFRIHPLPLFLNAFFEKLNPKERAAVAKASNLSRAEINAWQKLPTVAKKLEKDLKSAKLQKASQLYKLLNESPGEAVLYLLTYSEQRIVQDRIKNYFQKYLPMAMDVTDEFVAAAQTGTVAAPGTPKFQKLKKPMMLAKLDARPKKVAPPPELPPAPLLSGFGRGSGGGRPPAARPPENRPAGAK